MLVGPGGGAVHIIPLPGRGHGHAVLLGPRGPAVVGRDRAAVAVLLPVVVARISVTTQYYLALLSAEWDLPQATPSVQT